MSGSLRGDGRGGAGIAKNTRRKRGDGWVEQFRGWIESELLQGIALSAGIEIVSPERRSAPQTVGWTRETLHDLIVVRGIELPHVVAVDEINNSLFACLHQQMFRAGNSSLIGQKDRGTRSEIGVGLCQSQLVIGSEPPCHPQ